MGPVRFGRLCVVDAIGSGAALLLPPGKMVIDG